MRIVIAGGGTGGHLYPGIAVAEELRDFNDVQIMFLCTRRPFDRRELEKRDIPHRILPSPQGILSARNILPLVVRFGRGVLSALRFYREFRPAAVLGTGGFGSLPPIMAARLAGIPYAIMEQNVIPGKANRLVASGAATIFSQWEEARGRFGRNESAFCHAGSPLRREFTPGDRVEAKQRLGADPSRFVVGIVGGSQGAESVNNLLLAELPRLASFADRLHVVHLTGERDHQRVRESWARGEIPSTVIPFSDDMPAIYSACDLIVSRAGALAIAEMAVFGVPTILIPYPTAADGHQSANANVLARAGAALVIEERECKGGDFQKLIGKMLDDKVSWKSIGENLAKFARPDARREIARNLIENVARQSTHRPPAG